MLSPKYDSNIELDRYKDPVSGVSHFKPNHKLYSASINHKGRNSYPILADRCVQHHAKRKKKKRSSDNRWGLPQVTHATLPKIVCQSSKEDPYCLDPFSGDEEAVMKQLVESAVAPDLLPDEPPYIQDFEVSLTKEALEPKHNVEVEHEVAWVPTNHDYIVMLNGPSYTIGTIWEVIYKDHDPITIYTPTRNYPMLKEYTVLTLPGIFGSGPELSINRQRRIEYCHAYLLSYSRETLNSFTRDFQDSLLFTPRSNLDRMLGRVPGWVRINDLNPPLEFWKLGQ